MKIIVSSGDADQHLPPLVFLDIDDVICVNAPYGGYDVFAPNQPSDLWDLLFHAPAVETLRTVADEFHPRFVITSSWLRLLERRGFEVIFERCGMQFVADQLHEAWEAAQTPRMTRLQSIEQWLTEHHRGEPFVVLDDSLSGSGLAGSRLQSQGRVVLCKVSEGLNSSHLPQVRRALSKRVRL